MRPLRFPSPTGLYEVTVTTFQNRQLLLPTAVINDLILGVVGRAQRRYGLEIHALVFLSTHYHALLSAPDNQRLARFMGYVNSNIAREVGRVIGWSDRFWSRRYRAIPISAEESAQTARLHYLLSHGVKEGLVERPERWPGVHSWTALLGRGTLAGTWHDRTREFEARRSGRPRPLREFVQTELVTLTPLPTWRHLDRDQLRRRFEQLHSDIVAAGEAQRRETGLAPIDLRKLPKQDPSERLAPPERRPAPRIHAASAAARSGFREAYREFTVAFRAAAVALAEGDLRAAFPPGSFPPHLPWVPLNQE